MDLRKRLGIAFILCLVFLAFGQVHAQWDVREGLQIEAKAEIVPDPGGGLAIDVDIAYHNEGKDTLFMFITVPYWSGGNLDFGNMEMAVIPIYLAGYEVDAVYGIDLDKRALLMRIMGIGWIPFMPLPCHLFRGALFICRS